MAIAPEGAIARVSAGINRRPKRSFGVLKTENEYVGVVRESEFEIWERNQRAVHAIGRIGGRRGGSRIELRFAIPPRTRALLLGFFALYAVVAAGLAQQGPGAVISIEEVAAATAGDFRFGNQIHGD
ncbi:MAG: hypothetical protein AAB295_07275, partial [Chloroflexota bacterium]